MHRVFISYQSQNSNEVRRITEKLMANGLNVWFAEYEVLPKGYDDFDRSLETNLAVALRESTHAIFFTNAGWERSTYCRQEHELFVAGHSHSQGCIIQVRLPGEDMSTVFVPSGIPSVAYSLGKEEVVVRFIIETFGLVGPWHKEVRFPPSPSSERIDAGGFIFEFNPAMFGPKPVAYSFREDVRSFGLKSFYSAILEGYAVDLVVTVDPFGTASGAVTRKALAGKYQQLSDAPASEDRLVYRALRRFADAWLAELKMVERGLHLLHYHDSTQMALTFSGQNREAGHWWHRLYVLDVNDPYSGQLAEVTLAFGIRFPEGKPDETFPKACELFPCFDLLVLHSRYHGQGASGLPARREQPGIGMTMALYLVGAAVGGTWPRSPWTVLRRGRKTSACRRIPTATPRRWHCGPAG